MNRKPVRVDCYYIRKFTGVRYWCSQIDHNGCVELMPPEGEKFPRRYVYLQYFWDYFSLPAKQMRRAA